MSQRQPRRPQQQGQGGQNVEPIKYGDVFPVTGELASKPVAPRDAAMMQTAENTVLGKTQKGGTAATMQSAATVNERAGFVSHGDVSDAAGQQGVTVTETEMPGSRIVTESVGGQVVGQYVQGVPVQQGKSGTRAAAAGGDKITIGEALEAAATIAGDKVVDQSDAAAIQAAEVRATGSNIINPGGVAAAAQSAASMNQQIYNEEEKVKLGEVLMNATIKLPSDKEATRHDAEGVVVAELRNNPNIATHPGGVAASVAAAARVNEGNQSC